MLKLPTTLEIVLYTIDPYLISAPITTECLKGYINLLKIKLISLWTLVIYFLPHFVNKTFNPENLIKLPWLMNNLCHVKSFVRIFK